MKKISKIILYLLLATLTFSSCEDFFDVDSDRVVFVDEYQMTGANDTLYSMFAIFSQLQKIADSYVLLGELRADLMDVTDSSGIYIKEINEFNISKDNPYANNEKDYYAVINNCNYVLNKLDTSIVKGGENIMHSTYVAVKAIRAWTYMQVALNYGEVTYFEEPILSLADAQKTHNKYTLEELAPILINDINPVKDVVINDTYFGNIPPIKFILGDLYLWLGAYTNNSYYYEQAATEYQDLMYDKSYIISKTISNYSVLNNTFTGAVTLYSYWISSGEIITAFPITNQYERIFDLDSLVLNGMLTSSDVAINNWSNQLYIHNLTLDTIGDLRKNVSVGLNNNYPQSSSFYYPEGYSDYYNVTTKTKNYIVKYTGINPSTKNKNTVKAIIPYRVSLLYLRYAEAVNRLGKPNLAMAVLKYGLNSVTLADSTRVPKNERPTLIPAYMDFTNLRFANNVGVHARGCGKVDLDTLYYIIPDSATLVLFGTDSVNYVENLIQEELALENAFEGNRFHDLMRFAIRRDDNAYLADKVAEKHTSNKDAIRTKLMDRSNWYIRH